MTDSSDRYPDISEDADGLDAIVRELAEMDESHDRKAVGLLMCARTEFRYARADGQYGDDVTFREFAQRIANRMDEMDFSTVTDDGEDPEGS